MSAAIHHFSSHFEPAADPHLPPAQAQVIAALAQGHTVSRAARDAGLHRTTIHHWIRTLPEFKAAVQNAQREYAAVLKDDMRDLAASALETLHKLLESPATPPFVQLKTALAILERPQFPQPGWRLPESIDSPQKQKALAGLAGIEAELRAMRMADAIEAKAPRS